MSKEIAAKIAVRDALVKLVKSNHKFEEAVIADKGLPAWVMKEGLSDNSGLQTERYIAAKTATRLTYQPKQNKQETKKLPGIIGISKSTLELGLALNQARNLFKTSMKEYRLLFGDSIETIEQTSEELRYGLLGGLKIQHIHFVQSYRQLKLFPRPPKKVGFSWASNHSGTVRLKATEAINHLKNKYLASGAIVCDIRELEQMPAEEVIIIKRILTPHLRANLSWPKEIIEMYKNNPECKKQFPGQINTPLPIFLKLEPGEPLPEFNHIRPFDPLTKQERLQRSDTKLMKINDTPHSRIYRYSTKVTDN